MSTDFAAVFKNARNKLLDRLSDLSWHDNAELARVAGVRYGARLLELKRLGFNIESRGDPALGKVYRLTSILTGPPQPKRVKVLLDPNDVQEFVVFMRQCDDNLPPGRGRFCCAQVVEDVDRAYRSYKHNEGRL
jgi:hypothetical protein